MISVNDTTLQISFTAPISTKGVISHFEISVESKIDTSQNFTQFVIYSNQKQQYFTYPTGLCEDLGVVVTICMQAYDLD